jgi:predicted subunit of tRNA(5-methylaminomethyl-2-thiouridylate) methyltransferase
MKAGVLFSGGKDSSLAAIMLGTYYEVELNFFVFDPSRQVPSVDAAAQVLGFPLKKRVFRKGFLDEMVDLVKTCGYPNDAINTPGCR